VIRQAVSCDICGAEKRQTNHWFVAYEQSEELRLCGWNSRFRKRPGSMHLCGQKCLHKLVDDFMARAVPARAQPVDAEAAAVAARHTDTSLTVQAQRTEVGRPVEFAAPALPAALPVLRAQAGLAPLPEGPVGAEVTPLFDEPPRYATHKWREAWERERERETRAAERGSNQMARRGS
jgi:hypothetical protein